MGQSGVLADQIQSNFPAGVTMPDALGKLCAFADVSDREVSGNFEFDTDGRKSALAWFGGDESAASQFAVFGQGPDGQLYALWLHAGPDATQAPVVLLDSECDGNEVIAADAREFLRLLAVGFSEPGRYPTLPPDDSDSTDGLREWLSEEFDLGPPEDTAEMIAKAQVRHPDLGAWVRDWQERRGT